MPRGHPAQRFSMWKTLGEQARPARTFRRQQLAACDRRGNLLAWADGTDNAGHAALSN
jgi:hypothetical protein